MNALRVLKGAILAALVALPAAADEVPVNLQVKILSKMSTYIVDFVPAGTTAVKIMVLYPGAANSPSRGALAVAAALEQVGTFGELKAESKVTPYADAKTFKETLAAEKPRVLFLSPEFNEKAAAEVVEAISGSSVVTVSGTGAHVKLGVILGFSLVEARPRVLVNLKQAKKEKIDFRNGLLAHAVIVDR